MTSFLFCTNIRYTIKQYKSNLYTLTTQKFIIRKKGRSKKMNTTLFHLRHRSNLSRSFHLMRYLRYNTDIKVNCNLSSLVCAFWTDFQFCVCTIFVTFLGSFERLFLFYYFVLFVLASVFYFRIMIFICRNTLYFIIVTIICVY